MSSGGRFPLSLYMRAVAFLVFVIPVIAFVFYLMVGIAGKYFSQAQSETYNITYNLASNKTLANMSYGYATRNEEHAVSYISYIFDTAVFIIVLTIITVVSIVYFLSIRKQP